jgi:NTE family protein
MTGVSVGAINASFVANYPGSFAEAAEALTQLWTSLTTQRVVVTRTAPLLSNLGRWGLQLAAGGERHVSDPRALLDTSPLRDLLEDSLGSGQHQLSGLRSNLDNRRVEALALTATSYRTGRAITFTQGGPHVTGADWTRPYREGRSCSLSVDHVLASCALPLLFPAVSVAGEWFGDGSIRQGAPLSPAIHLGAQKLLVISTARPPQDQSQGEDPYPSPARVAGTVVNAMMFDSTTYDAEYATRVSTLLRRASHPDDDLRPVDVLVLKPTLDLGRLAADYEHHLPRVLRHLTRGWGTLRNNSSDLMATLLFEAAYTRRLIELGRRDADEQWSRIEAFVG